MIQADQILVIKRESIQERFEVMNFWCCFWLKRPHVISKKWFLKNRHFRDHPVPAAREWTRALLQDAIPFFDIQKRLSIDLDHWMTAQSAEQPSQNSILAPRFWKRRVRMCTWNCWYLRKERMQDIIWRSCRISVPAEEEKQFNAIMRQQDKLTKERKYTPPPHHLGKEDPRPWGEQLPMAGFRVCSSLLESLCTDTLFVKVSKNKRLLH